MTNTNAKTMDELLRMVPDTGFSTGKDSNTKAEYTATHPEDWKPLILSQKGRPKRGEETGSVTKSVRFPESVWRLMEEKAKAHHLNLHAALREAVLEWAARR